MRKTIPAITLVALVLLIAGALYYSFIDPYASRLVQARVGDLMDRESLPQELTDATYLLSPVNGGGIYREGQLSFEDYSENGSLLVDLASSEAGKAKLLHNPTTDTHDVLFNETILLSSDSIKKFLSVSDDGQRVSVAVKQEGVIASPSSWKVMILDSNTKQSWTIDAFGALFLDTDTVIAFRGDGVFAVDYETGEETLYLEDSVLVAYTNITQSADGEKIAWTTLEGKAEVYELIESAETPMMQISSLDNVFGAIALGDSYMYELMTTNAQGTKIVAHALYSNEPPQYVRSFPSVLAIKKLIP